MNIFKSKTGFEAEKVNIRVKTLQKLKETRKRERSSSEREGSVEIV